MEHNTEYQVGTVQCTPIKHAPEQAQDRCAWADSCMVFAHLRLITLNLKPGMPYFCWLHW